MSIAITITNPNKNTSKYKYMMSNILHICRSGHQVKVTVNNVPAPSLAMVLDSTGSDEF